jgi:hypothetical protein
MGVAIIANSGEVLISASLILIKLFDLNSFSKIVRAVLSESTPAVNLKYGLLFIAPA